METITSDNAILHMNRDMIHREKDFLINDIFSSGDIKYDTLKLFGRLYSSATIGKKPIVFI